MRAAVFVEPGRPLEIRTLPDPTPGPGQVVLRIERCGICGTDLHFTDGHSDVYPRDFIPGHESGAEVVSLGKGVEGLKVGDHVVPHSSQGCGACAECLGGSPFWCKHVSFNMGGFAQYKLSQASACIRLPSQLPLKDAAIVEPLACGLHAVSLAGLQPGATVAVLGAGPMGLAAIFWARRFGAARIVCAARTTQREALARSMGADAFYVMDDDFDGAAETFLGGAPDVVFECTGVAGLIDRAIGLVRPRGIIVVLGICMHPDTFLPKTALLKEITVRFSVGTLLKEFETAADVLAAGHVEPLAMVTRTVSLDELPNAFEALRVSSSQCKVLVDPTL